MDVKSDIQYLQLLLDCAFSDDHPSHQCLQNIVNAIESASLSTVSFPSIPSGWRSALMDATLHDLNDPRWLKPFFDNALTYPCIFYRTMLHGTDETRLTIKCNIPYSENIAVHCVVRLIESTWHQDDILRLTLVKMLTDSENMLD